MKRIRLIYILVVVFILEILLSTLAYNEPSFTTVDIEQFDVSRVAQNQAENVVNEKWTFNITARYLEISMEKAAVSNSSLYDVGVPINTPLNGDPTLHAGLFVSNLNVNDALIRVFVVLANETHIIELNYCIGEKLEDEIPDPDEPTRLYLYFSASNTSNRWVTIDRKIVTDLAAKNISIETEGNWRISKFCAGGIIHQKGESAVLRMLVDVDQTYLDLGGVKVYSANASMNTSIVLLIAGLFVFSCMIFVVESLVFQRRNAMKLRRSGVFENASLVLILQFAFLVRLVFLDSIQLSSDEAIYTYTSYLLTKGVLPYKEVFMAHPPLSFYITAFFMQIFEPSYPSIRLFSTGIFLVTVILTYLLGKVALGKLDGKYSLFAAALYALYPSWFTINSIASLLENLLTMFILLSIFFYVLYHRENKSRYLWISGFLGGCALLTTVRAAFFLMSLVIIHLIYAIWTRKSSQLFRNGLFFAFGFAFPISFTLGLLTVGGFLRYFYLDIVTYHISIFRISMNDRLWYLGWYLTSEWLLLLLAVFGIALAVKTVKQTRDISVAIPGFVFFLNFFSFSSFGFFMHYLQFLCPFLSIISILGIIEVRRRFLGDRRLRARSKAFVFIFLVVIGLFYYFTVTNFYQISSYFYKNPYDKVNYYIAKRIANITSPSDYIWAGDAAIGFFSKRIIAAPSADFRFIGCSDSVIGFDYGEDRGTEMRGYNDGFVTVEDFIQSWESKRVKVLVFIMNKGWLPYVDPLLWNGYREHVGAAEYVSREYELEEVVFGENVPYIYYIWVRRE